ncbi:MAG: hypothetical protein QFB87_02270 [Patescibacteria group bacterium]|nr:hypothetical protein [Patescibacteria group bacterium]
MTMIPLVIKAAQSGIETAHEVRDNHAQAAETQANIINSLPAQEAATALSAVEQAKTRRTALRLGAGVMAAATVVGGGLYVADKAGQTFNKIFDTFKPSIPHVAASLQVETALQSLSLPDEITTGRGLVESNSELKLEIVSCPPVVSCWTITSGNNTSKLLTNINGVVKGKAIELSAGHSGDGTKLADYYPVATIDPRELSVTTSTPTSEELQAAGHKETELTLEHGGNDGDVYSYLSAATNLLGLSDKNNYASRADITDERAKDAAIANCGPVLDKTLVPGLVVEVKREYQNAINLNAALPASSKGPEVAKVLSQIAQQPVHIRFGYTPEAISPQHKVLPVVVSADSVHFYQGRDVKDLHAENETLHGTVKNTADLSTTNSGCKITPAALDQLLAISDQKDAYVIEDAKQTIVEGN